MSTNYIACNGGPNPTTPSDKKITVAAGSTAKLTWRHTLTSGPNDVVDSSHKGPVQAYVSPEVLMHYHALTLADI